MAAGLWCLRSYPLLSGTCNYPQTLPHPKNRKCPNCRKGASYIRCSQRRRHVWPRRILWCDGELEVSLMLRDAHRCRFLSLSLRGSRSFWTQGVSWDGPAFANPLVSWPNEGEEGVLQESSGDTNWRCVPECLLHHHADCKNSLQTSFRSQLPMHTSLAQSREQINNSQAPISGLLLKAQPAPSGLRFAAFAIP